MLLFSPPRCDLNTGNQFGTQSASTSRRFSIPFWPTRPASSLVALRSLQQNILPQPNLRPTLGKAKPPKSPADMSSPQEPHIGSPRSPSFSPTLGSIQEVFEYEPSLSTPEATSPFETQDIPVYVLPEAATPISPTLSLRPTKGGIILNPRRATASRAATRVANVLRNVLEADRLRRRRALRIYLKAIVFLKLLLKSHERYGTIMATSGMYMQR